MYHEDDLVPLSALQHFLFCERQCALIHIERLWVENVLTAEGRVMHRRVDEDSGESRGDVRIARGVRLRSLELGLTGKSDVVEFHRDPSDVSVWTPFPVEYKRGKPKVGREDEVQLCAQALCLEEMLEVTIPRGALFYGRTRRRFDVDFDAGLRELTHDVAERVHELLRSGRTPIARREPKCERCSLLGVCLPGATGSSTSAAAYVRAAVEDSGSGR